MADGRRRRSLLGRASAASSARASGSHRSASRAAWTPELRGAGAGDGGGLATLLLSLTQALDAHPAVSEVVTFTRAFEDPSFPGLYSRPAGAGRADAPASSAYGIGPDGYLATAEQWGYRGDIEAALTRAVARHGPFDVAHLRFADVGTFAAARVFRRLGVPVVFTLAPDPHSVLRESEAAGRLDRATFPAGRSRAPLRVPGVARRTDAARGGRAGGAPATGRRAGVARHCSAPPSTPSAPTAVWTIPEGIAVDTAARQTGRARRARDPLPRTAIGSLPERRRASVAPHGGATQPCQGHPRSSSRPGRARRSCSRASTSWSSAATSTTRHPRSGRCSRRSRRPCAASAAPARDSSSSATGRMPRCPQILRAAAHGIPGVAGTGGVYACPSRKEEFGLSLLEALAAGLSVVGPDRGGPPTFVEDGTRASWPTPPTSRRCEQASAERRPPGSTRPARPEPVRWSRGLHDRCDGRPAGRAVRTRDGRSRAYGRMTALLVSPDYVSHYLRSSAVGAALRDDGHEVVVATGDGLRERVLADGFLHVELRLGAGSNPTPETGGGDQGRDEFLAATHEGMVSTLEHQARRRLHDLLWEPSASPHAWRRSSTTSTARASSSPTSSPSAPRSRCGPSACRTRRSCPATRASCRRPGSRSAIPPGGRPDSRRRRSSRR